MRDTSRFNNFDLIRLFAATQVIYIHSLGWLHFDKFPAPFRFMIQSVPGVPIFFVISGFLVTQSFLKNEGGIRNYFWRRGLRIYPALWTHFIFIMALLWAGDALPIDRLGTLQFWKWLGTAAVIGNDFWANIAAGTPFDFSGLYKWFPSGVLWTLTAELGFYCFVPLIFCGYFRRKGLVSIAIAAAFLASFACAILLAGWQQTAPSFNTTGMLGSSPLPFFWIFLIGSSIAWRWDDLRRFFIDAAPRWLAFYAIVCSSELFFLGRIFADPVISSFATIATFAVLGCLVISCAFTARRAALSLRGVDVSYGLYLYHMPVIATLHYAGIVGHWWLWSVAYLVPLALAISSWFLIERPALRLKGRWSEPRRRVSMEQSPFRGDNPVLPLAKGIDQA
jgi:peptidoglycan/LPS O-acetylase OafA/YrhL